MMTPNGNSGWNSMRMDLNLKTKQAFWETPHNIAILLATVATLAGLFGYKLGSTAPQPIVLQLAAVSASAPHAVPGPVAQ